MSTPEGTECFIFRLPDELLNWMLNVATLEYRNSWDRDPDREPVARKTAKALPLVCRRFNTIAQPLLYETAVIKHVDTYFTSQLMHRTMQENPHLRSLCKSIVLSVWDWQPAFQDLGTPTDGLFDDVKELFSWWTSAQSVHIEGIPEEYPYNSRGWDLVQTACQNMPRLKELIVDMEGPLLLSKAIEIIQSSSLNVLTLKSYPEQLVSDSWIVDSKVLPSASSNLNCVRFGNPYLLTQFQLLRISPITFLTVDARNVSPSGLAQAIQWPARLEKFALGELFENDHRINLHLVQSLLSIRKETLKEIRIEGLEERPFGPRFNASGFPNLEVLSLALFEYSGPTNIRGEHPTYDPEEDSLLPPKLKTLKFTYGTENRVQWGWFLQEDEQFIRNIAKAAIDKKVPLQTIEVDYVPYYKYAEQAWGYPYERLERLSQEFGPQGIKISYPTPPKTKKEWVIMVARSRIYGPGFRRMETDDPDGLLPVDIQDPEDIVQARVALVSSMFMDEVNGPAEVEMLKEMLDARLP